jgi:hypothetical protein
MFTPTISPVKMNGELYFVSAVFYESVDKITVDTFNKFYNNLRKYTNNILIVEGYYDENSRGCISGVVDENHLIQVKLDSKIFAKENLLNYGIRHLPKECDKVCLIDCDIYFQDDFIERVTNALNYYKIIQPYRKMYRLKENDTIADTKHYKIGWHDGDYAYSYAYNRINDVSKINQPGGVWAARRYILDEIGGLFDRIISGASDRFFACGIFDDDSFIKKRIEDNFVHKNGIYEFYKQWAEHARYIVGGSASYINVDLYHMYHGDTVSRGHYLKNKNMYESDFSCSLSITTRKDGINNCSLEYNHTKINNILIKQHFVTDRNKTCAIVKNDCGEQFYTYLKKYCDVIVVDTNIDGEIYSEEILFNNGIKQAYKNGYDNAILFSYPMYFTNEDWLQNTVDALKHYIVVQPFAFTSEKLGFVKEYIDNEGKLRYDTKHYDYTFAVKIAAMPGFHLYQYRLDNFFPAIFGYSAFQHKHKFYGHLSHGERQCFYTWYYNIFTKKSSIHYVNQICTTHHAPEVYLLDSLNYNPCTDIVVSKNQMNDFSECVNPELRKLVYESYSS